MLYALAISTIDGEGSMNSIGIHMRSCSLLRLIYCYDLWGFWAIGCQILFLVSTSILLDSTYYLAYSLYYPPNILSISLYVG
jgi:hypothetical protein